MRRNLLWAVVLSQFSIATANADPITLHFTVIVDHARGPLEEELGRPVAVGDRIPGLLRYESSLRPYHDNGLSASYDDPTGVLRLGNSGGIGLDEIDVVNMSEIGGEDSFTVMRYLRHMSLFFFDDAGIGPGVLSGTTLPRTVEQLAAFPMAYFLMSRELPREEPKPGSFSLAGRVVLNDPTPVPEPASITLLGIGLVAAGWKARQRRSH